MMSPAFPDVTGPSWNRIEPNRASWLGYFVLFFSRGQLAKTFAPYSPTIRR